MEKRDYVDFSILVLLETALLVLLFRGLSPLIDVKVNDFVSTLQSVTATKIMLTITFLGSIWFIALVSILTLVFLAYKEKKIEGTFYFLNVFTSFIFQYALKELIGKERPSNLIESGLSFPSGHTLCSAMTYWSLAYLIWNKNKLLAYFLIILPAIIGFTRIYLQVHWVTDVLASLTLACVLMYVSVRFFFQQTNR